MNLERNSGIKKDTFVFLQLFGYFKKNVYCESNSVIGVQAHTGVLIKVKLTMTA